MNKKTWLKISIILIFIIIIALIVTLYFLNQTSNTNNNNTETVNDESNDAETVNEELNNEETANEVDSNRENVAEEENDSILNIVNDRDIFYTVSDCVEKYLNYCVDKDSNIIYNLLDEEYKERFDINEENVLSKVETYDTYKVFRPKKIYQLEQDERVTRYFVYGTMRDETNVRDISITERQETDIYMSVKLDFGDSTYSIMPDGYMYSQDINHSENINDISITVKDYTNYINSCEVTVEITNNTNTSIDVNNLGIQLQYNEEEGYKSGSTNEETPVIEAQQTREVTLIFENNFKTPKQIVINNNETGSTVEIPLQESSNNNN